MNIYKRVDLIICSLLINLFSLSLPLYIIHALTRYLNNGIYSTLVFLTLLVIVSMLLEFLLRHLRKIILINLRYKYDEENKNNSLEKIIAIEKKYINKIDFFKVYDLEKKKFNNFDLHFYIDLLDLPYIILFGIVIYLLSPAVFLIFISIAFIYLIFAFYFQIKELKLNFDVKNFKNKIDTTDLDTKNCFFEISFQSKVKQYFEKNIFEKFKYNKLIINKLSSFADWNYLNNFISNLLITLVMFISLIKIQNGDMQIASLIALNILVIRSLLPLKIIPKIFFKNSKYNKNLEKIFFENDFEKVNFKKIDFGIELKKISLTAPNISKFILKDFSFTFTKGKTTVVTGPNGSGKTFLFNVLAGYTTPNYGNIIIDKVDIRNFDMGSYKKHVGVFNQNPKLLNCSLLDNYLYANPKLKLNDISSIIEACDLNNFVNSLKDGLNTNLYEINSELNYSLLKMFAFSKMMSKSNEVLILDEPTEGLDVKNSQIIYNYINNQIKENKIVVVFSKDPYVINGASNLITLSLDDGSYLISNPRV